MTASPTPVCTGLCREGEQWEGGPGARQRWSSLPLEFIQQTRQLSDVSLSSKSGVAPPYRGQKGLESGDPSLFPPPPPWASASPSVEWGRRGWGWGACHSPCPAVPLPGLIPRFPLEILS